jgi:hypothetical protein
LEQDVGGRDGLSLRGRQTEAASISQAKIAKIVAPSKTRVHAIEVANHTVSFMAYPQAALAT